MERIEKVLAHYGITDFTVKERYHEEGPRIMCRIETGNHNFFLKGLPGEKMEQTVRGNVLAHEYLGNQKHMAPEIIYTSDGHSYIAAEDHWFYMMEYIDGKNLEENAADEYALGQLAAKLHSIRGYGYSSGLNPDKARFYGWFSERHFKEEFDRILDELPDFTQCEQCLIHTDMGPHNAMRRSSGEVVLIDLDDAGIGARHLDLGWPFIMQFVDFNHQTEKMQYRFDLALAFLRGYYGGGRLTGEEYDLIWQGAVFMHISYMQVYGPDAVESLWKILRFGMNQKQALWERWNEFGLNNSRDNRKQEEI